MRYPNLLLTVSGVSPRTLVKSLTEPRTSLLACLPFRSMPCLRRLDISWSRSITLIRHLRLDCSSCRPQRDFLSALWSVVGILTRYVRNDAIVELLLRIIQTVRKWIEIRNGLRLPQDRLRSGYGFWFVLIPVPMLMFGWCIDQHVGGLPLAIVTAFFASCGILGAFAGVNTYCAEVMPWSRPEAIATKYVIQYILSAAASGAAVPLVDAVGVGLQTTVGVIMVLVGGVLCVVTAWYGIDMQNWVDKRWPAAGRGMQKVEEMYGGSALQHTISAP